MHALPASKGISFEGMQIVEFGLHIPPLLFGPVLHAVAAVMHAVVVSAEFIYAAHIYMSALLLLPLLLVSFESGWKCAV